MISTELDNRKKYNKKLVNLKKHVEILAKIKYRKNITGANLNKIYYEEVYNHDEKT